MSSIAHGPTADRVAELRRLIAEKDRVIGSTSSRWDLRAAIRVRDALQAELAKLEGTVAK